MNNPINLIDPDGMDSTDPPGTKENPLPLPVVVTPPKPKPKPKVEPEPPLPDYNNGAEKDAPSPWYLDALLAPAGFENKVDGQNNRTASSEYRYGDMESLIAWTLSASSTVIYEVNTSRHNAELAYRTTNLIPHKWNLMTGATTWVNPKYLKYTKWAGPFGYAGDAADIWGARYNGIKDGWTLGNRFDMGFALAGLVPIYGDAIGLEYMLVKPVVKYYANNPEAQDKLFYSLGMFKYCFAKGTKISMGNSTYKNIENVQIGDSVLTYNFTNKKFEINPVLETINIVHNTIIKVVFSNNVELISTDDHPYYIKGKGWCSFNPEKTYNNYGIKAGKLEESDICFTIKGQRLKKVKVNQIISITGSITTYNLSIISNSDNYFVNGILVNTESLKK